MLSDEVGWDSSDFPVATDGITAENALLGFREYVRYFRRYVFEPEWAAKIHPRHWLIGSAADATRVLPAGTIAWRAQAIDTGVTPDAKRMGAPPIDKTVDCRASAPGISVFYAAEDEATAVSEVCKGMRKRTWVAKWALSRDARIFDFADTYSGQDNESARYFRLVSRMLAGEVPEDHNAWTYVPTQFIVEIIRNEKIHGEVYDGVRYHSARSKDGRNIVFFDHRLLEMQGDPYMAQGEVLTLNLPSTSRLANVDLSAVAVATIQAHPRLFEDGGLPNDGEARTVIVAKRAALFLRTLNDEIEAMGGQAEEAANA